MDALVNDALFDQPSGPPVLGGSIIEPHRRATPTIPPGFSAPAVPNVTSNNQTVRLLSRSTSTTVPPAVPAVGPASARAVTPIKAKKPKQNPEPAEVSTDATASRPTTPVKANRKSSSARQQPVAETPKRTSTEAIIAERKENKTTSLSPAKSASKSKPSGKKTQAGPSASPQKETGLAGVSSVGSKRQHPGKLDIAAATKMSDSEQPSLLASNKTDAPAKAIRAISMTAGSLPASPAATSTGSPIKKSTGTRTLRVVATPKTENPPPLSAVSSTSLPQVPTVEKLRSRQASIASLNQPGTPASDLISDTASITSTSISRANSPPPIGGKIGTAPMRKKTKSQQKKERQERARQAEEERTIAIDDHKSEPEVVQAPIIGRKKKTKKPANNPKPPVVPIKTQPEPPKTAEPEPSKEQGDSSTVSFPSSKASTTRVPASSKRPESTNAPRSPPEKHEPTAQSILADLQKTGELIASTLEFFKPLSSSLAHASRAAQTSGGPVAPPDLKIHFTEADLDALAKKHPVRLKGHDGKGDSRTLITPGGKFFWGLTQELEERALELEKHIEELKGNARFHPRKQSLHHHHHHHHQDIGSQSQSKDMLPALATALKEAGAKLSKSAGQPMPKLDPTSTLLGSTSLPFPPVQSPSEHAAPQQAQQQQTPADAGAYLNQFVLPQTDNPPANTPRPEMAAVGGPPGSGTANMSVNVNKIAKAAKAVAEGGAVGTELEGMGVMAADLLGGVFVQGLEALVGAGLGFSSSNQELGLESSGTVSGLDVQNLVSAFEASGGLSGYGGRLGRRSVLSMDEAEQAMLAARKEHEALGRELSTLIKKNKKMVGGAGKV